MHSSTSYEDPETHHVSASARGNGGGGNVVVSPSRMEMSQHQSRSLSPLSRHHTKKKGRAWKRLLKRHRHQVVDSRPRSIASAPNSPNASPPPHLERQSTRMRTNTTTSTTADGRTKGLEQVHSSQSMNSNSHHDGGGGDETQEEDGDDVTIDGQGSHHSSDSDQVRKVALVWKKKSGFTRKFKKGYALASEGANFLMAKSHLTKSNRDGTYKYTGASNGGIIWERRKLVLDNTMLMYFDIKADVEDVSILEDPNTSLFEKMKYRLKWPEPIVNDDNDTDQASRSAINTPRGAIDLLASHATAHSVSTESYHSPTPYVLYVVTRYESKWAICFETSDELSIWLGLLSNVTLRQSEATYKKGHGSTYSTNTPHEQRNVQLLQTTLQRDLDVIEKADDTDALIGKRPESSTSMTMSPLRSFSRTLSTEKPSRKPNSGGYKFVIFANVLICYICFMFFALPLFFALIIANGAVYLWYYHILEKFNVGGINDDTVSVQSIGTNVDLTMSSPPSYGTIKTKLETPSSLKPPLPRPTNMEHSMDAFVTSIRNLVNHNDSEQVPAFKPDAGSTTVHLKSPNETVLGKIGWVSKAPSSVAVRGANYLSDKKKSPSPGSLYELIQVDVFDADTYVTEISHKVKLPKADFDTENHQWLAPDILVVSFALPTAIAKLGRTSTDLRGYIVTGYYRIRQETRTVLSIITSPDIDSSLEADKLRNEVGEGYQSIVNGVRLWETWCRESPSNPEMQKRLKFIPKGDNLRELKVPNWMCKYNGKPMLIKRPGVTGFLYPHSKESILEIGISLHPFPYMFKQAMTYLKDNYFPKMLMTFSFVIEGRDEKELPEVLLGNPIQLPYVDTDSVIHADDVFQ